MKLIEEIANEIKDTLIIDVGLNEEDANDLVEEHVLSRSTEPRIRKYISEMIKDGQINYFKTGIISSILKKYKGF